MPPQPERRAPLLALALACLLRCAAGAGVFELQILEFSNYRLELASGACCAGAPPPARSSCAQPCRTRFHLCLKEYQSAAAPGACSFGRASSPVLGTDSFTLADPLYTLALNFTFRWTRSFTLILQAYDDSDYTDPEAGLIEEAWWSGIVEPGAEWHALRHAGAAAAVAYRVRVLCASNYYNSTCTTFCRPRDDKFGHYACSATGDKHCLPGWQGDNCEKPVCKEGCHPMHGRCDKPGECLCRPGWRGELCDQCTPYPGCKHGFCNGSPWDCTCDTNWGGILCDQDLNYCGTHEPCQHGGTCENTAPDQYLCTCAEGFSGDDCERVDNPCAPQPCAHGACSLSGAPRGYACACHAGWTGALCDEDIDDCASAPCAHAGTCRDRLDGFTCDCAPGWTGPTCEQDVDECAPAPAAAVAAPASLLALAALAPLLLLAAAAGAVLLVRRRRAAAAAAERSRRCDEEKSNNLQNEENLRRYANPLREEPRPAAAGGGGATGPRRPPDSLPRAHSLYKAQNADARNDTPPRDKELTKRALPPPEPPPARHPPPERLTVLV